jgi:hypothetical protein
VTYITQRYDSVIDAYCVLPNMPVQRDLRRRANSIQRMARRMVGVETGRLRNSIKTEVIPGVGGVPGIRVGSNVSYALLHHEGTRRHVIHPRMRKALRFKIRGRVVYATEVLHPGTRPNHYLTIPLERYGRG